jgi:heme oxygenase
MRSVRRRHKRDPDHDMVTTRRAASGAQMPRLSVQLKTRTRAIHRSAERAGILRAIAKGDLSRLTYARYLRNLHPVYVALESRLQDDPRIGPGSVLAAPGLLRASALRTDLEALVGGRWRHTLAQVPTTGRYREDVENSAFAELIAHAYVRYLADLNGGAILRRALVRHLRLSEGELNFHAFPEIARLSDFVDGFRTAIDSLVPHAEHQAALIAAERAFGFNIALAEEVMRA